MYAVADADAARMSKAAKRKASLERKGMMIWLPITLAVNAIFAYFGVVYRVADVTATEWCLIVLSLAAHYWAYTSIITWWSTPKLSSSKSTAKDREGGGQDGVDILALVSVAQLGSLFTSWAWLALLVVAGMLGLKAYAIFASASGAIRGMMGGAAGGEDAGAAGEDDAAASGPRKSRAQLKKEEEEKQRKKDLKRARKMAKHGRR